MEKIYDPILCMMVEPGTTSATRDAFTCMTHDGFDVKNVRGHYEVYKDGKLVGSADNMSEAKEIIKEEEGSMKKTNVSTIDKAIRALDESEESIAEDLFEGLHMAGKKNLSRSDAQWFAEVWFDGTVKADKLMDIFRKYKNKYRF